MGVGFSKMEVDFLKMGISFSENGSYFFRKWELIF